MTILVSVVIPTCNRNDLLAKCLRCLAPGQQTLPASQYEVIVTDDGESARLLADQGFGWVNWVNGPKRGPAANRNNGAKLARGQWLAFTDDDCLPDSNWLKAITDCASTTGADVVEGKVIIPDKVDNPFLRGIENLNGDLFWSCNLSIRRQIFEDIGRFDEDFLEPGGEDMELAWRFKARSIRTHFCQEALVLHPVRPLTFKSLIWRTKMDRWIALYYHKTGQATPLSQSNARAITCLALRQTINQLRKTWHFFSRELPNNFPYGWKTAVFNLVWGWLTFPFILPYMLLWEIRFRQQLAAKHSKLG